MARDANGKFIKATKSEASMATVETGAPEVEEVIEEANDTLPGGGAESTVPPGKRGRGRPPGSKSGGGPTKRNAGKSDAAALARQIVGGHVLASMFTGIPELIVNEQEARMLADALIAVAEEYGFALGGKTGATLQLLSALGMVYGTRVFAIAARIQKQQQEANAPGPVPTHAGAHGGNVYTTSEFQRE
jgi:hypothetical protein